MSLSSTEASISALSALFAGALMAYFLTSMTTFLLLFSTAITTCFQSMFRETSAEAF